MTLLAQSRSRHGARRPLSRTSRSRRFGLDRLARSVSPRLALIAVLWSITLLLGGSSRPDAFQIILLRPLAALALAFGLLTLSRADLSRYRFLVGLAAAVLLLSLLHAVPLPYTLWSSLPGRELVVDLDRQLGLAAVWRPISMAPSFTWNAIFALVVPLAFLVNAIQLDGDELKSLLALVIFGGLASAALALMQLFSPIDSFLYFYRVGITKPEPLGFFANQNHQALLLSTMYPLLAAFAARRGREPTEDRRRLLFAVAAGILLFPVLIVAGSRAGFALGLFGISVCPFIYARGVRVSGRSRSMWWLYLIGVAAAAAVAALSVANDRSVAIDRAAKVYSEWDQRYHFWKVVVENYDRFMPLGSGVGTYQPVYQTFEPRGELTPEYSNHAHNDFLELLLTAGYPGIALLIVACAAWAIALGRNLRAGERGQFGATRLASFAVIAMTTFASAVDYPARTPIISALLVLCCVWVASRARRAPDGWRPAKPVLVEAKG